MICSPCKSPLAFGLTHFTYSSASYLHLQLLPSVSAIATSPHLRQLTDLLLTSRLNIGAEVRSNRTCAQAKIAILLLLTLCTAAVKNLQFLWF